MKSIIFLTILCFLVCIHTANTSRILAIIQSPSYSHQIFYQPLWKELANRGHDMVVITSDPTNDKHPNIKEISIKESYPLMKAVMDMMVNTTIFQILLENKIREVSMDLFRFQLELPAVQAVVNNETEHFDLLIIEHYLAPMFGFKHRFKCPMIGVSSMDALSVSHNVMGNPTHSVLYPLAIFQFQENLSLLERLAVTVFGNLFIYLLDDNVKLSTEMAREYFGEDMPDLNKLFEDTDMLFVNANPVFSAVRPHSPSTISLAGGMHLTKPQPLPKNLRDFLEAAEEGFIYFSLGTNVNSNELSPELRTTILETFSLLPYKVLWKFEDDTLPKKPVNVQIVKWAPQQDILRHPNIKLFITQGGLQSLEEALYMNVPIVAIPFIADQRANAEKVKHKKLGLVLDWKTLTINDFKSTIIEVINNPVYKETSKLLSKRIQDEPMTPLQRAVWWTEYLLRHKSGKHLKGPKLPFYQYYYLDVLSVLLASVLILLGLLLLIGKYLIKSIYYIINSKKSKDKVKQS